jgi:hypothetical protein
VLRPILRLGDSILSEPTRAIEAITPELDVLINDMIETMYAAPGIGLAAPQVGVPLKLFVIDLSLGKDPAALHVMLNPQFVEREGMQLEEEGCLSIPGFTATVARRRQGAGPRSRGIHYRRDRAAGSRASTRGRSFERLPVCRSPAGDLARFDRAQDQEIGEGRQVVTR